MGKRDLTRCYIFIWNRLVVPGSDTRNVNVGSRGFKFFVNIFG